MNKPFHITSYPRFFPLSPTTIEELEKAEMNNDQFPQRAAYFGFNFDGNRAEPHDVNIIHQWTFTPKERAYIDGILDMAIYNIMENRRAEPRREDDPTYNPYNERTEQLFIIEPVKHEAGDES